MAVGQEKLSLPSTFRELWITVAPISTSASRYTVYVLYDNLPTEEGENDFRRYRTGYASSNDAIGLSVIVSRKEAYVEDLYYGGTDYTKTACMRIKYR